MSEINIAPHIKELNVFDDEYYCHDYEMTKFCPRLDEDNNCGLFPTTSMDTSEDLHIIKCPQCKEAWKAAKGITNDK